MTFQMANVLWSFKILHDKSLTFLSLKNNLNAIIDIINHINDVNVEMAFLMILMTWNNFATSQSATETGH